MSNFKRGLFFTTIIASALWWRKCSKTQQVIENNEGAPTAPTTPDSAANKYSKLVGIFGAKIEFYGQVQDQHGTPIAGAKIRGDVAKNVVADSLKVEAVSNSDGKFQILETGMSLSIRVSKDGFFPYPEKSGETKRSLGIFDFGSDFGQGVHKPNSTRPVVFTLFRPDALPELNRLREMQTELARDGKPVSRSLDSPGHKLVFKCWADENKALRDGRFDWSIELSVPNGGVLRRTDSFEFTAPADGYSERDSISMPKSLERKDWHDDVERQYWIKFNDGIFGTIKIRVIAGGAHYVLSSGWLNPNAQSRNLTVDPKRRK